MPSATVMAASGLPVPAHRVKEWIVNTYDPSSGMVYVHLAADNARHDISVARTRARRRLPPDRNESPSARRRNPDDGYDRSAELVAKRRRRQRALATGPRLVSPSN